MHMGCGGCCGLQLPCPGDRSENNRETLTPLCLHPRLVNPNGTEQTTFSYAINWRSCVGTVEAVRICGSCLCVEPFNVPLSAPSYDPRSRLGAFKAWHDQTLRVGSAAAGASAFVPLE